MAGASASAIKAGEAFVELFVNDNKLTRGLKAAEAKIRSWAAATTAAGAQLGLFGGTGLAAGIATLNVFQNLGSELSDLSDQTGIGIEALQELGIAARQSGGSMELMVTAIGRMQRFLVEAANGSREANNTLADLGLNINDLARMTGEQQFTAFAEAISRIENPALRTARAMEVMGRGAGRLVPTLLDLANQRALARAGGRIISEADVRAAEAFGDQLSNLVGDVKLAVFAVGASLVPTLRGFADVAISATLAVRNFLSENRALAAVVGLGFGTAAGLITATGVALITLGIASRVAAGGLGLIVNAFQIARWVAMTAAVTAMTVVMLPWKIVMAGASLVMGVWNVAGAVATGIMLGWKVATALSTVASVAWKVITFVMVAAIGVLTGVVSLSTIATDLYSLSMVGAAVATAAAIPPVLALQIALVALAAVGLAVVAAGFIGVGIAALEAFRSIGNAGGAFSNFGNNALRAFSLIRDQLGEGDLEGAMRTGMGLARVAWEQGLAGIEIAWVRFSTSFANTWDIFWTGLAQQVHDSVTSILDIIKWMPDATGIAARLALAALPARASNNALSGRELARNNARTDRETEARGRVAAAQDQFDVEMFEAQLEADLRRAFREVEMRRAEQAVGLSVQSKDITGTFSAAAARGFAGISAEDRTARATEDTARLVAQVLQFLGRANVGLGV